jgi:hypothetical protein
MRRALWALWTGLAVAYFAIEFLYPSGMLAGFAWLISLGLAALVTVGLAGTMAWKRQWNPMAIPFLILVVFLALEVRCGFPWFFKMRFQMSQSALDHMAEDVRRESVRLQAAGGWNGRDVPLNQTDTRWAGLFPMKSGYCYGDITGLNVRWSTISLIQSPYPSPPLGAFGMSGSIIQLSTNWWMATTF